MSVVFNGDIRYIPNKPRVSPLMRTTGNCWPCRVKADLPPLRPLCNQPETRQGPFGLNNLQPAQFRPRSIYPTGYKYELSAFLSLEGRKLSSYHVLYSYKRSLQRFVFDNLSKAGKHGKMKSGPFLKVAVTQAEPEWLDLPSAIAKTISLITEAAKGGAKIVAFPECWIAGYPGWIW